MDSYGLCYYCRWSHELVNPVTIFVFSHIFHLIWFRFCGHQSQSTNPFVDLGLHCLYFYLLTPYRLIINSSFLTFSSESHEFWISQLPHGFERQLIELNWWNCDYLTKIFANRLLILFLWLNFTNWRFWLRFLFSQLSILLSILILSSKFTNWQFCLQFSFLQL